MSSTGGPATFVDDPGDEHEHLGEHRHRVGQIGPAAEGAHECVGPALEVEPHVRGDAEELGDDDHGERHRDVCHEIRVAVGAGVD